MAARQGLQRRERHGQPHIEWPPLVEVFVQRREGERNPLHRADVNLDRPHEPRRRKRENHTAQRRGRDAQPEAAAEHVRAKAAQRTRQQRGDIHRQDQIAGEPHDRCSHQGAADQVFRIGECLPLGIHDVGIEDRERMMCERVDVPPENPQHLFIVRAVGDDVAVRTHREGIREDQRQRDVERRGGPEFANSGGERLSGRTSVSDPFFATVRYRH